MSSVRPHLTVLLNRQHQSAQHAPPKLFAGCYPDVRQMRHIPDAAIAAHVHHMAPLAGCCASDNSRCQIHCLLLLSAIWRWHTAELDLT